ncbi:UNVERIFIED_CONTAM: hypothetical protein Slati_4268800 [Sesamum latifolium]|uniref:Uncharacterized protein n=1 Tax=Sesamum latifolium TaxID=2727402 RepID=A0AAW2TC63_9LAMI
MSLLFWTCRPPFSKRRIPSPIPLPPWRRIPSRVGLLGEVEAEVRDSPPAVATESIVGGILDEEKPEGQGEGVPLPSEVPSKTSDVPEVIPSLLLEALRKRKTPLVGRKNE